MKKILRWLCEVTDVAQQIRDEHTNYIGHQMHDAGYWLSSNKKLMNCIQKYAEYLKDGRANLFGSQFEEWRKKVL